MEIARFFGVRLTKLKACKVVPVFGGLIGATVNYLFAKSATKKMLANYESAYFNRWQLQARAALRLSEQYAELAAKFCAASGFTSGIDGLTTTMALAGVDLVKPHRTAGFGSWNRDSDDGPQRRQLRVEPKKEG